MARELERQRVDVPVADLVAPVVVKKGQQRRDARQGRMQIAVDGACHGDMRD